MELNFEKPLVKATIIKRYKRFLADVVLEDGREVTAHCPNTGSMRTCWSPNDVVYLTYNPSPKRKLDYTWDYTQTKAGLIAINTMRPNRVVEEAIVNKKIPELKQYDHLRREVKYGENSKIDLLLEDDSKNKCWVEVKNVTLFDQGRLLFPDAVTKRGLKHLHELTKQVEKGDRAVMFYLINRSEGDVFSPAGDIDPEYTKALKTAEKNGVEILAYRTKRTLEAITMGSPVKVDI